VLEDEDISGSTPWILLPEDPVGAWADDFPYEVDKLIQLANRRFLMTPEEKESVLEMEAMERLKARDRAIRREFQNSGQEFEQRAVIELFKDQFREEKQQLWWDDHIGLQIPFHVGGVASLSNPPKTREDIAAYRLAERNLQARSAWRVED